MVSAPQKKEPPALLSVLSKARCVLRVTAYTPVFTPPCLHHHYLIILITTTRAPNRNSLELLSPWRVKVLQIHVPDTEQGIAAEYKGAIFLVAAVIVVDSIGARSDRRCCSSD
jgi:hypothetical protein